MRFGPYTAFSIHQGVSRGETLDPLREYPEGTSFSFAYKGSDEWRGICTREPGKQGTNQLSCTCVDATCKSSNQH